MAALSSVWPPFTSDVGFLHKSLICHTPAGKPRKKVLSQTAGICVISCAPRGSGEMKCSDFIPPVDELFTLISDFFLKMEYKNEGIMRSQKHFEFSTIIRLSITNSILAVITLIEH